MNSKSDKAVVTFGELLLRLDPPAFQRCTQAETFTARYTGAEANVAASLAEFGIEAYAVSKVPEHEIGQACVNYLRRFGIRTDFIVRGGDRLGILYVETGFSQRPSNVIYDRNHSSIREVTTSEFDWKAILSGKQWFHFSGTAPALGANVVAVLEDALDAARAVGVVASCDCNYRSKLWSPEEAGRVLSRLMGRVDVLICGIEDARKLFGIEAPAGLAGDEAAHSAYVAGQLRDRFGCSHVAMTLRGGQSASLTQYAGMLSGRDGNGFSKTYEIEVVDRVGAGDAFAAGIIYKLLLGASVQDAVEFAAASACLKHTIPGDFNLVSLAEVEQLLAGGQGGRVQR
ncbi:MAG: sugar kinase [Candidatus Hydrogenedentes bacterium]|nr:sugar kinase [Candidatus Hydrogenedentota bacterium]